MFLLICNQGLNGFEVELSLKKVCFKITVLFFVKNFVDVFTENTTTN